MERHGLQRKFRAGATSPVLVGYRRRHHVRRPQKATTGAHHHASPRPADTPIAAVSRHGELQAGIPVEGRLGRIGRALKKLFS